MTAPPTPAEVDARRAPTARSSHDIADRSVIQTLLRCWLREHGLRPDNHSTLRIDLAGSLLDVPIVSASPTGWHRFGQPRLDGEAVGARGLVASMAAELACRAGLAPTQRDDVLHRTIDSLERIAHHVADRGAGDDPAVLLTFLEAEQGLVAGHPFHPAAKSREGWDDAELAAYSPELRGTFPLRWLAVARDLVVAGSAAGRPAEALVADLPCAPAPPAGFVAIPVHPWQARTVLARPEMARLLEDGAVRDLGDGPARWSPTSSLRTVWHPQARWMLKLSLGVRITNSRRDNRRRELRLGEQAHRLLAAGLAADLAAAHPCFGVVTDPAWLGADIPGRGLEVAFRHNPFGPADRAVCVAGLVDERPGAGGPVLARLLHQLAHRRCRPVAEMAERWLSRYVRVVAAPLTWLDGTHGIVLEAHHQNTLVTLDDDGWPVGGWYRDSQGWYVSRRAVPALRRLLPELGDGVDVVFDDDLVAQRGAYYLGVNNLLGLVGALAAAEVADEERLLLALRAALGRLTPSPVLDLLLGAPTISCKANLLTCADGRDELAGPVSRQSVYVEVPNPLTEVTT